MRIAFRWLCSSMLIFGALACGSGPDERCSAMDGAAGRCQPNEATPAVLPPGTVLPDWVAQLCKDWRRPDGSCDPMQILADYQECFSTKGIPEQNRMLKHGVGSHNVLQARDRATNVCLELRKWFMTEEAQRR